MANGKFVSYLRVSTGRQGKSGLGLEAQRQAVDAYLNGGDWQLVEEFVEIESGRSSERPKLEVALQLCRAHRAALVVANVSRLPWRVFAAPRSWVHFAFRSSRGKR
jgi:DNA invertase Pin-like site-specific DNA recombinase